MRIITGYSIQMIDACHINPFSESHDDTISNGISLCPNLHRAFGRLLITLDEDYRVVIKPFAEDESIYSIKQFDGKQIICQGMLSIIPRRLIWKIIGRDSDGLNFVDNRLLQN